MFPCSLLHQLEADEKRHGKVNVSMLHVCWQLLRPRLLLVNLVHLFINVAWIIAIVLCLSRVMLTADELPRLESKLFYNEVAKLLNETEKPWTDDDQRAVDALISLNTLSRCSFVGLLVLVVGLKSVAKSVALSAAVSLRNACAGAVYLSAVRSSVQLKIPAHRIVALCADDGAALIDMVQKGGIIVSQSVGLLLCIGSGAALLGSSVLIALVGVLVIAIMVVSGDE